MKTIFNYALVALLSLLGNSVVAQTPAIGTWVDYLPYSHVTNVVEAGEYIYGATEYSLVVWNKSDNSVERFSKVHGLSDVGVTGLGYHEGTGTVLVGYSNGNIDLIRGSRIINFADIKRSSVVANKAINNVYFRGDTAYLSCGFGITLFDMSRDEIMETYVIGPGGNYLGVNDLVIAKDSIFCATEEGVYYASMQEPNLKFHGVWNKFNDLPRPDDNYDIIQYFGDRLLLNLPVNNFTNDTLYWYDWSTWEKATFEVFDVNRGLRVYDDQLLLCHSGGIVFFDQDFNRLEDIPSYNTNMPPGPNEAIIGKDGIVWIADRNQGIVRSAGPFNKQVGNLTSPHTNDVEDISFQNGNVWVAAGTKVGLFDNAFNFQGVFRNDSDREWSRISRSEFPILDTVVDIIAVEENPTQRGSVYAAAIGAGIIEFENYEPINIYDHNNSPIGGFAPTDDVKAMDVKFDLNGNLWMLTNRVSNFLTVKTPEGVWKNFEFASYFSSEVVTREFLITKDGMVWVVLEEGKGIFVFNPNGTIEDTSDDQVRVLSGSSGNGGLHSTNIHSMVEDLDGEIWVGTAEGVAVFFSPSSVFVEGLNIDAQRIFVTVNGFTQYLLETEVVKSISVDGANRKWFGTEKTGVFLMSEDGTEQLHHFTAEDSPIFSNEIKVVRVNPADGEVFIGTNKGLQAFKGTATQPDPFFNEVYAYPNPVREDYDGLIAVKGLARNSSVKIIDINGNLVFETYSEGGQAIWNGRNMSGRRVATGVYLVLAADSEGEEKEVTKILFIH